MSEYQILVISGVIAGGLMWLAGLSITLIIQGQEIKELKKYRRGAPCSWIQEANSNGVARLTIISSLLLKQLKLRIVDRPTTVEIEEIKK